jgi:vanillate O-demethylase monooxygenase subunit
MTSFLRNTWYAAAYDTDLTRSILARRVLDEPLIFYRREDGTAVAMQDECPHRFAPLSEGRLIGDHVQCPYHGLEFDCTGSCVLNPHPPRTIPRRMVVKTYPLIERHGMVWIWMGEANRADPALIPDFAYLEETRRWRTVRSYFHLPFGADLMFDNLMDLSHAEYLHRGTVSQGYNDGSDPKMTVDEVPGHGVRVSWVLSNYTATEVVKGMNSSAPVVEHHRETTWWPPGVVKVHLYSLPAGMPRDQVPMRINSHLITPETATSTHDFSFWSRDFDLEGQNNSDEGVAAMQRKVIVVEDGELLEKIQRRMGARSFESMNPVLFDVDVGASRVRRTMASLVEAEAREEAAQAPRK